MPHDIPRIEDFTAVGITHWDAPVPVREGFSLPEKQQQALIEDAERAGFQSIFVISTCNRTELFAQCANPTELVRLLLQHSGGTMEEFKEYGFEKIGRDAVIHLFSVATGLDSQILGDLQIIKQVKESYERAADLGAIDGALHRLIQHVFRAHKRSRSETDLAQGAATTAYAAVQFAQQKLGDITDKKILLVGTGKIGKVTCRNLVSMGASKLTLINRSRERAEFLAGRYDLEVVDIDQLPEAIAASEVVIVATGADNPVIKLEHMTPSINKAAEASGKVMLDLSVPRNIDPKIEELDFVDVANMDLFEDVTDEVYEERKKNIPLVKNIIDEELTAYELWLSEQKVVPTIKALTQKFDTIRQSEFEFFRNKLQDDDLDKIENLTRRIVNKIAAHSIEHLRENRESEEVADLVKSMFKLENSN